MTNCCSEEKFWRLHNSFKPNVNDDNVSGKWRRSESTGDITGRDFKNPAILQQVYDDLRQEADEILQQLYSRLNVLPERVEEIGKSIELIQGYSYQYNLKIVGLPEIKASESASDTTILFLSLFQAARVEISVQDIDIAHRTPTRNATPGPGPVTCKFTRRIAKEKVMNVRLHLLKLVYLPIAH